MLDTDKLSETHRDDVRQSAHGPVSRRPVRFSRIFFALACLGAILFTRTLLRAHGAPDRAAIDSYDGKALLADETGKVSLFDVSVPSHPVALSTIDLGFGLNSVAIAGDNALAGGKSGIYILSLVDPKAI